MSDRAPGSRFPRQGLDRIRDRRAGAPWEDERIAGPGLQWVDGQLTLRIGRKQPVRLDRNGDVVFAFDPESMEVVPGSPFGLRAKLPDVAPLQASVVALRAENAALASENAALVARVEVLEAAEVTLSSTVVDLDARLAALEVIP